MKKYLIGALFAASVLVPFTSYAASLTQQQIDAILALLKSFGADQTTTVCVQAALVGNPAPAQCTTGTSGQGTSGATPTVTISASPASVTSSGAPSTITWSSSGASFCRAWGTPQGSWAMSYSSDTQRLSGSGTIYVTPTNDTATIVCMGPDGYTSVLASTTVKIVSPPPSSVAVTLKQSLDTTHSNGTTGDPFTIAWSSTGATSCSLRKTITPAGTGVTGAAQSIPCYDQHSSNYSGSNTSGQCDVAPFRIGTHVFTLTCTGPGGTTSTSVQHAVLTVSAVSSLSAINPTSGTAGTDVTITGTNLGGSSSVEFYSSTGQVVGSFPLTAVSATSASFTIPRSIGSILSGTYQVGVGRGNRVSFTLTTPPPTTYLKQSSDTTTSDGTTGQPFTLTWYSSNTSLCSLRKTITPAGTLLTGTAFGVSCYDGSTNGSCTPTPNVIGTHTFTFTCSGLGGSPSSYSVTHTVTQSSVSQSAPAAPTTVSQSTATAPTTVSQSTTPTPVVSPTAYLKQSSDTTVSNGSVGQAFTLAWSSSNAPSSCSLSKTVTPDATGVTGATQSIPCYEQHTSNYTGDALNGSCDPSPNVVGTHVFTFTCMWPNGLGGQTSLKHQVISGTVSSADIKQIAAVAGALTTPAPSPESYTFTLDLYRGQSGVEVTALQKKLAELGFFKSEVTGWFYDATREAVIAFQRAHGVIATGYVGPETRAKLNSL